MGHDVANLNYEVNIQNGLETGFYSIDQHLKDLKLGELTVLLGRNGDGKTTMISQIINHCIVKNQKIYLYSGELSKHKVQDWVYKGILGKNKNYYNIIQGKYEEEYIIKPEIIKALKTWHKDRFFLFENEDSLKLKNIDEFFKVIISDVERFKPKLVVIDNLATSIAENSSSVYSDQGNVTQTCKQLAMKYNLHCILVVHPNKNKEEIDSNNQKPTLTKYDSSGSTNISNKCDNFITIERNWYEGQDRIQYDGWISILKDRTRGFRKVIPIYFNKNTLRMYDEHKDTTDYERYEFLNFLSFDFNKNNYSNIGQYKEEENKTQKELPF